jgi:hypothetical protein
MSEHPELMVSAGRVSLVTDPLVDVQGTLVLPGRLVIIPTLLGDYSELVDPYSSPG